MASSEFLAGAGRRYLGLDVLARARVTTVPTRPQTPPGEDNVAADRLIHELDGADVFDTATIVRRIGRTRR